MKITFIIGIIGMVLFASLVYLLGFPLIMQIISIFDFGILMGCLIGDNNKMISQFDIKEKGK